MNSTRTATTDGLGRSVQITNGRFVATMMTGLLPVADMVSRIQLLAHFEQALEQTHKQKDRSLYSAGAMFRQRVFAHICGFEDLADHDVITEDEGFLSALGVNDAAGSSTLCRFENSITIRCHTNFRHPFNLSWSGKTCDIGRFNFGSTR